MLHGLNGKLYDLVLSHVIAEMVVFFELFFEIIDGLLFLDAAGNGPVAVEVTGRVEFEELGTPFVVDGTEDGLHSVRSHERFLSVHLTSVTHPLG